VTRFFESPIPGLEQAYEGEPLHEERSGIQRIQVFDNAAFGCMLVLDGLVQTSERDEFFYHEMLVHPPLVAHPSPERVLVIGGGDGGTLRRVLEHPTVREAVMVEIDERVTAVCREWLPSIAGAAFDDERATVLFEDGDAYVRASGEPFDAIIVDSSDPVGPGAVLFGAPFYRACRARLRPGGVLAAQVGSPLYFLDEARNALAAATEAFGAARVYLGPVPVYPGTLWAYLYAGPDPDDGSAEARAEERKLDTRYWTPEVQRAAFALPRFLADALSAAPPPKVFGE
jgi:spermidine synthase